MFFLHCLFFFKKCTLLFKNDLKSDLLSLVPFPISTRLDWLVALPSFSWKVKVPSSAGVRASMNISITPVFLSKFILYFCEQEEETEVSEHHRLNTGFTSFSCLLTSPWEIATSLKTYSILASPEIFSACSQKRTLPFSSISTANSDFRGMTRGRWWGRGVIERSLWDD